MAAVDFEESDVVRGYAEKIIDEAHPHLQDAKDLIGFYVRFGSGDWAGKAKKCSAFERFVTGKMMFVFVNNEAWDALKSDQRFALIDHELCHFSRSVHKEYDDDTQKFRDVYDPAEDPDTWSIRDHDVEEFSEVIARHGLWEKGIESFAATVRKATYQTSLMDEDEEDRIVQFRGGVMA